jgi:hypothetical protein
MSSCFPDIVTVPKMAYFTTFGLVEIKRLNDRTTWLLSFFCSSIFALMSKNSSSVAEWRPVFSACKLFRLMETVTPPTEYCGFTADSSLFKSVFLLFNFYILLIHNAPIKTDCLFTLRVIGGAIVSWHGELSYKLESVISFSVGFLFEDDFFGHVFFDVDDVVD